MVKKTIVALAAALVLCNPFSYCSASLGNSNSIKQHPAYSISISQNRGPYARRSNNETAEKLEDGFAITRSGLEEALSKAFSRPGLYAAVLEAGTKKKPCRLDSNFEEFYSASAKTEKKLAKKTLELIGLVHEALERNGRKSIEEIVLVYNMPWLQEKAEADNAGRHYTSNDRRKMQKIFGGTLDYLVGSGIKRVYFIFSDGKVYFEYCFTSYSPEEARSFLKEGYEGSQRIPAKLRKLVKHFSQKKTPDLPQIEALKEANKIAVSYDEGYTAYKSNSPEAFAEPKIIKIERLKLEAR